MHRCILFLAIVLPASTTCAAIVPGATFSGTLSISDPTWAAPTCLGTVNQTSFSSLSPSDRLYDAYPFQVSVSGNWTFDLTGPVAQIPDTVMYIYQSPFSAASPLANVLVANDDKSGPPSVDSHSRLTNFALSAGSDYVLVVSSNSPSTSFNATGDYTVTAVTAVPEPGTLCLLLLASPFIVRRRRRG